MKNIINALIFISLFSIAAFAQTKTNSALAPKSVKAKPAVKPVAKPSAKPNTAAPVKQNIKPAIDKGEIVGTNYTNKAFNFAITLPENWIIPGDDFEKIAREQGFNLDLQTPEAVNPIIQTKLNQTTTRVSVLLNAFKYVTGTEENAILRVSIEDLRALPQVKDAVDYFDLMRETYKNIKLPADFKYSETQAEKLGKMQFGFLDTANNAGKKRMYATVRNGYAVMFTLTYKSDNDLAAIKRALAEGNFKLK